MSTPSQNSCSASPSFKDMKEKNIYEVLSELQALIANTENPMIRGDLTRLYNDLLLKI